ncbi:MAG: transposase, partial [Bacteroidia bacterium]
MADTFAYCLMPNHFHFLIRTKEEVLIEETFGKSQTFQKLESRISKQFANLFSSYTQSYNKVFNR